MRPVLLCFPFLPLASLTCFSKSMRRKLPRSYQLIGRRKTRLRGVLWAVSGNSEMPTCQPPAFWPAARVPHGLPARRGSTCPGVSGFVLGHFRRFAPAPGAFPPFVPPPLSLPPAFLLSGLPALPALAAYVFAKRCQPRFRWVGRCPHSTEQLQPAPLGATQAPMGLMCTSVILSDSLCSNAFWCSISFFLKRGYQTPNSLSVLSKCPPGSSKASCGR